MRKHIATAARYITSAGAAACLLGTTLLLARQFPVLITNAGTIAITGAGITALCGVVAGIFTPANKKSAA